MTFEVDGRAVLEDEDLMKAMYAQGFGYSGWWNAAMLDRLNDMLGGGFGVTGPFVFRIKGGKQFNEIVSRGLKEVILNHRVVGRVAVVYE